MNKALELFSATPRLHNCAQSVVAGCNREDLNSEMRSFGSGRAPEGLCGAIYGAMACVNEEKKEAVQKEFEALLGSSRCKELKANGVPCSKCVETAAALVEKYSL